VHQLLLSQALLPDGWANDVLVTVEDGLIRDIARGTAYATGAERVAGVAVPGVANLHNHAFQRAMAGLAERRSPRDDTFWTWREVMYRLAAALTPDDIEAVAAWAYLEMLEAGFTAVGEFHYLHLAPDGRPYADPAETGGRIVAAAAKSGIGLTLLPSFYAHNGCGSQPPLEAQKRFVMDLDGFARLMEASRTHVARLPRAALGLAPHSLRAVDASELAALLAAYPEGPIHMHAAEQAKEVEECLAWSGARPVAWLLDNAPVSDRWCLIHCTHTTPNEVRGIAGSGAVVGLCPITEANLGDGLFEAARFVEAGGTFGVGSDSGVRISLAEELRVLELSQRLRDHKRNVLAPAGGSTGRFLFEMAARGGSQALGLRTGALTRDAVADIVVLDPSHPVLVGRSGDALLDAWIFASDNGPVRDVWVGGRHVVNTGRHVARDLLYPPFARALERLAAVL
jgi:formiminoglutamate deiminase